MSDQTIPDNSPDAGLLLEALVDILRSANSPEVWQAQSILLRRLALQGDVIGSRVPAPTNITEIGGYLNLLENLRESEMRAQTLAGILGVAGPNPPLGWIASSPALAMVVVPNDRPAGPSQPAIPLEVAVRSDFVAALQHSLDGLHQQGAFLPLLAPPTTLPSDVAPDDVLAHLGRVIGVVPATALSDPASDPVVLARAQGDTDPFALTSRVITPGPVPVAVADWEVLQCDSTSCTPVAAAAAALVPVGPVLAAAGFYPAAPLPEPTSLTDAAWSRFTNVTGLVTGITSLGDELARLHDPLSVSSSAFADRLSWVWDGTAFGPPPSA